MKFMFKFILRAGIIILPTLLLLACAAQNVMTVDSRITRSIVIRGIGFSEQRLEMTGVVDSTQEVELPTIAVAGIDNLTRVKSLSAVVRKEVTAMLIRTGRFQGVEREPEVVDKILAEQRYQNLGMLEASVELGKFIKADYVAVAKVYKPFANAPAISLYVTGKEETEKNTNFRYAVSLDVAIFDVNTKEKILTNSKRSEIDIRIGENYEQMRTGHENRGVHFAECVRNACTRMVKEIQRDIPISGHIIEQLNTLLVGINLGRVHGLREKQRLMAFRLEEIGKTPEGKPILGGITALAELEVVTPGQKFSSTKIVKLLQSDAPVVGALVITVD
jgi:hypothetical protein